MPAKQRRMKQKLKTLKSLLSIHQWIFYGEGSDLSCWSVSESDKVSEVTDQTPEDVEPCVVPSLMSGGENDPDLLTPNSEP